MTLEGAIKFNETESYIIYTMNSVATGQYGVVVPKNIVGTLNMLVDLHMKGSFDSVSSGVKTKEQLIEEIGEEYTKLKSKYVDGMLVLPMIDEGMFQSAVLNNDKQKMFDEVKKIGAITSELYKKLTDSGVEKQKIDQKIIIVEKNDDDEKFVVWLKEQMPNFVDGIRYSELVGTQTQSVVNPFVDSNSIFGAAVETPKPVTEVVIPSTSVNSGSIFDNPAPVSPVASQPVSEQSVPSVPVVEQPISSSVVEQQPVVSSSVDIFGTPIAAQPVPEQPVPSAPVESVPAVESTNSTVADSVSPVAPVLEEPKPVSSAALEGTIAFTPIPNHPNNPVEPVEEENTNARPGSKGFANLIILLVILVGVTIASIELGKFLYSVYGA